jgi:hypothetical protein
MPARLAATDPYKQISEYAGSGLLRFLKNEWVPGAGAVAARRMSCRAHHGRRGRHGGPSPTVK